MYRNTALILVLLALISGCMGINDENNETGSFLFSSDWEFMIDSTGISSPGQFDDSKVDNKWEKVSLPHTPVIEPLLVNDQWQGECWYRKTISYDQAWEGKKLFLRFEGAMNVAELWVNGDLKITHSGGYLPFVVEITDEVLADRNNVLYVKLNNEDNPETGPKPLQILDFNMYGGLYRDVFLQVKNQVHITDAQFANVAGGGGVFVNYPEVSHEQARVSIKTHVRNSGDKAVQLEIRQSLEQEGISVAGGSEYIKIEAGASREIEQELVVQNPLLWSPETPDLYHLETTVRNKRELLDSETTRIGIRKFEFRGNELYINGEKRILRGVNRHQEYPYIGYALSNNAQYRDALKIKNAGFDCVRLSHYPHSPAFMDACDELGLITIDAILGWQYYSENENFKTHVLQSCRDLIRRDRNHPSVLAWEVSLNESWMPEPFIDSLIKLTREEYPGEDCYTAGWQKHGYDIYLQARQHRLRHHESFPDMPYIVSEYGDWEYFAMNAGLNQDVWEDLLKEERSSRQARGSGEKRLLQQALNIQEAHNDNFTTPAVADGYWVMYDYNRGYADDLEMSGIMDIFRLPKYSYHFFRSQRSVGEAIAGIASEPMVFIASEFSESSSRDIRIFSNCDELELLLNGKSLGSQKPDQDRASAHLNHPPFTFNDIPFSPGTLTAIGKINGSTAAQYSITTAGEPVKIVIEADLSGRSWESGVRDAIFAYAKVVDENMQLVHNFAGKVNFEISGDAYIIGNISPQAEGGIATVLVMAGADPDEISITAVSGELQSEPFFIISE